MSQDELAKELNISRSFINKLVNNKITEIRIEHLYKLRKFFNCSGDDIINFVNI
jgi:DNA-binding Xre family transcriptional regulator